MYHDFLLICTQIWQLFTIFMVWKGRIFDFLWFWDQHISDQSDCENDENLLNLCKYYWKTFANSLLSCDLHLIDGVWACRNRVFVSGMQIIEKLPKLVNKPALIILYVAKFDYVKKKVFGPKTILRQIFGEFNKMLITFDRMLISKPKSQSLRFYFSDILVLKSDLRWIFFSIYVITLIFFLGAIT